MLIEGSYSFPASAQSVFDTLGDVDALGDAIPGCERLIQLGPAARDGSTNYEARLRLHDAVYIASMTVTPDREAYQLRLRLHGRGPDGLFRGEGGLALGEPTDRGHTLATYRLELEAPALSTTQAYALANGTGRLFACAICDQLTEDLRARAQQESAPDTAEELLRLNRVDRLIRAETALGEIVAVPPEKAEPFSPIWFQNAAGMLAGLAIGLSMIAVTAATMRRLLRSRHGADRK